MSCKKKNRKKGKMKKSLLAVIPFLGMLLIVTSCVSTKKMVYIQSNTSNDSIEKVRNFEPAIQIGDLLDINVSTVDAEAALPFNLYESPVVGSYTSNLKPLYYLVDAAGEIQFPVIGKLKVAGKTTKELTNSLTTLLTTYLKNPIINIRFKNFKITVLGEVKAPGVFVIQNERVTVFEAIGLAGDLNIQGERKSVTLIREVSGVRKLINLDLTSKKIFNSPYFYLAQNDVLYVTPNKTKINSSAVGSNAGLILSSISTLISLIAILTR